MKAESMPADQANCETWPGPLRILALDGGGAKALFTTHVLARLQEDLGLSLADSFDLIAGLRLLKYTPYKVGQFMGARSE
jgi:hypothetical protein